jgi:GNAT superfamily N-acetyltransferase
MTVSDPSRAPATAVPATSADPAPTFEQCDECGSPVDAAQRYCVVCGAHRRHVDDPAARYLGQASARTRGARMSGGAAAARRPAARGRGLGAALMLALIPVAAALGVAVGRSSDGGDAKLIQALAHHQAAVVTTQRAASSPAATASAAHATSATTASGGHKHRKGSASKTHTAAKANATTQYGTVTQIAGSKPTKAQEQQGASATQKVQKSTGKTYVNQQNNLPGTVVVP